MNEDQEKQENNEDEYIFEETSLLDSEWFEYSLYAIAIIVIGILIVPLLSFNPSLDHIAVSLQKSAILVGMLFLLVCIFKLISEFYFNASPPLPTLEELASIDEKIIDLNRYRLEKQGVQSSPLDVPKINPVDLPIIKNEVITKQILDELDWRRFEQLCSVYFSEIGVKNALTGLGADGGIDIKIFDNETSEINSIVQCKRFSNQVSVKLIREFYGVMSSENIHKGYFITNSTFYKQAIDFAKGLNIELINGYELIHRFSQLPIESQVRLFKIATHGDYKTPSCVKCGGKMVERKNKKTGDPFWACPKPRCRTMLTMKK